jgi:hypothetical protein
MKMNRYCSLLLLLALCVAPALAQSTDCPEIVQSALQALEEYCEPTSRNQACLGSVRLDATAQPDATDFRFEEVGDIEDVIDIESLRLFPMDEENGTWGVAMMRLQANLPDTLPGQNVTFLLYGDVEVINNGGETPMQAIYLATGLGNAQCSEAPDSGLLVQTPQGAGQITFNINGVDISAGSTVVFSAYPGKRMRVSTLQGAAILYLEGEAYPVIAGTYVDTPMDSDLEPYDEPADPQAYTQEDYEWLPEELLGEEIEVADPLTDEELEELIELIDEGEPLCDDSDDSFLPPCEHLPEEFGGAECTSDPDDPDLPLCEFEESEFAEDDSDSDSFADSVDACPFEGDVYGTGVDDVGCPNPPDEADSDSDGYVDSVDSCPFEGDVNGTGVDSFGCPNPPP